MASECAFTYKDYSAETSHVAFKIQTVTAANFDATNTLINTLSTAILGVQTENTLQSKRYVAANNFISRAKGSTNTTQREHKWIVAMEDSTLHTIFRHEIPQANAALLDQGSDMLKLDGTEAAALVSALEAVVKSPAGNAATVLYIQYSGKRI